MTSTACKLKRLNRNCCYIFFCMRTCIVVHLPAVTIEQALMPSYVYSVDYRRTKAAQKIAGRIARHSPGYGACTTEKLWNNKIRAG